MSTRAFERLAPFIQDFIWKKEWTELRDVQVQAIDSVLDTDRHLLLAAGTASGKTEAAFLPILTDLYNNPSTTVGVLYIGPLKALINDQFGRLNELCEDAGIPVTAWHGDIGAAAKKRLLREPQGILQITPEALEGLLLNRSREITALFGDLRWVVVDEIHAFMASDRGGQVLALLDRMAHYALDRNKLPRRAGLSATLGDYTDAARWLQGADSREVEVVSISGGRDIRLLVEQFKVVEPSEDAVDADAVLSARLELFEMAYQETLNGKSLIFANKRTDTEMMVTGLRRMAERRGTPDMYHVHHGNIAPALREAAESAMRESGKPACTAATVTLELGIDLGQLDTVLQVGPPSSVSSWLQRLGRAGRRGQTPVMGVLLPEEAEEESVLERIPWDLIQSIAVIQTYTEERWVEPLRAPRLPASLLYQQTMSIVGAAGELSPAALAERVLTLAPFVNVTFEEFRALLRHLVDTEHLEVTDEGSLMLGLNGEREVRNFRFLATFQDDSGWRVVNGGQEIGTVGEPIAEGEIFALAGRTWEVVVLVAEQKMIGVRRVRGRVGAKFPPTTGASLHEHVARRMRRVLDEDTVYSYLGDAAKARLQEGRQIARSIGITKSAASVRVGHNKIVLVPWCGSRIIEAMAAVIGNRDGTSAYPGRHYLTVSSTTGDAYDLHAQLRYMVATAWSARAIVEPMERRLLERAKYDRFVPDTLLKNTMADDVLDIAGAQAACCDCVDGALIDGVPAEE